MLSPFSYKVNPKCFLFIQAFAIDKNRLIRSMWFQWMKIQKHSSVSVCALMIRIKFPWHYFNRLIQYGDNYKLTMSSIMIMILGSILYVKLNFFVFPLKKNFTFCSCIAFVTLFEYKNHHWRCCCSFMSRFYLWVFALNIKHCFHIILNIIFLRVFVVVVVVSDLSSLKWKEKKNARHDDEPNRKLINFLYVALYKWVWLTLCVIQSQCVTCMRALQVFYAKIWFGNWICMREGEIHKRIWITERKIWKGGAHHFNDRQCFRVFTVAWIVSSAQVSWMLCSLKKEKFFSLSTFERKRIFPFFVLWRRKFRRFQLFNKVFFKSSANFFLLVNLGGIFFFFEKFFQMSSILYKSVSDAVLWYFFLLNSGNREIMGDGNPWWKFLRDPL